MPIIIMWELYSAKKAMVNVYELRSVEESGWEVDVVYFNPFYAWVSIA
jgi:hypothetical protein